MKRIIILVLMTLTIFIAPNAGAAPIFEYKTTEPMSKGVELITYKKFYSDRSLVINVVKADLKEKHLSLDVLACNSLENLQTVMNHAKEQKNTVAAINADFFSARNTGFAIGAMIKDGEIIKSKYNNDYSMAGVFYDGDSVILDYYQLGMSIVAPNGNYEMIKELNTYTGGFEYMMMYTDKFNSGMSLAPGGDVVEVVVENDTIKEFRRNQESVKIPANGYVLDVSEGYSTFLAENFKEGDKVILDKTLTPNIKNIQTAFGGGTILLKNGQETKITHDVEGKHPRSALGTNEDGTVVYLVAVDGRQTASSGVTLDDFADILKELGCTNAINLDGGGSTALVGKSKGYNELHTINNPCETRRVINCAAITSDTVDSKVSSGEILVTKPFVFTNDKTPVSAHFYNNYFAEKDTDVSFRVSGVKGYIENGVFYPKESGKAIISATYDGITATQEVDVIDLPERLLATRTVKCDVGGNIALTVYGYDRAGRESKIDNLSLVSFSSDSGCASVSNDGIISGVSSGEAIISAKFGTTVAYSRVTVGNISEDLRFIPENLWNEDKRDDYYKANDKAFTFNVCSISDMADSFIERAAKKNFEKKTSNLSAFAGKMDKTEFISCNKAQSLEYGSSLFITLNASNGGIRATDSTQWDTLKNAVDKSKAYNLFIVLNSDITTWSDNFEREVFEDYLANTQKDVYVIYRSTDNFRYVKDGVHYFALSNVSGDRSVSVSERIKEARYLSFYINEDGVTYSINELF